MHKFGDTEQNNLTSYYLSLHQFMEKVNQKLQAHIDKAWHLS